MDHQSILDRSSPSPAVEGDMPGAGRSAPTSVSAGIAAANALLPRPEGPGPRFPAEDGGRSLAEIAQSDLDAALQLLAERAQYITGASGAAIALRRGQRNDMLCRASTGSNAPELGSLLSMEYGLSGESVRTRQALRCDDAERDPRVNREGCRQLGIASVVVMPVLSEQQVLGVFELFSGKPRAFKERDISALQRLSEMVETAVKHAVATPSVLETVPETAPEIVPQIVPEVEGPAKAESQSSLREIVVDTSPVLRDVSALLPNVVPGPPVTDPRPPDPEKTLPAKTERAKAETKVEARVEIKTETKAETKKAEAKPEPVPKKPLFWSAAMQTQASAGRAEETAASILVPPVLRNLKKCQACGFPVSQGRTFCVECEEKQWRGQRLPQPAVVDATPQSATPAAIEPAAGGTQTLLAASLLAPSPGSLDLSTNFAGADNSTLFLSSSASSESWFAANKFIFGALLVVAIVIAMIAWLR
jgi:hypothetical protein